MLQDEIRSDNAAVSFTAGAGAVICQSASFPVFLPEFMLPIWIQVIQMPGMINNINHVVMGLDNSARLGMVLDVRQGMESTVYHTVPCSAGPLRSEHQAQELVSRQFAGCEFGCVEKPAEVASIGGNFGTKFTEAWQMNQKVATESPPPEETNKPATWHWDKPVSQEVNDLVKLTDEEREELSELEEAIEELAATRRAGRQATSVQEIKQQLHEAYKLGDMRINYRQEYKITETIEDEGLTHLRRDGERWRSGRSLSRGREEVAGHGADCMDG
jgi:hypothetical protein